MQKEPSEIADYIAKNNSDYWNKSDVAKNEELEKLLFSAE